MIHPITDEEIAGIGQELAAENNVSDIAFARAIESAVITNLRKQPPSAWWIEEAEQFHIGKRPFAKAWTPLYANPLPPDDVPDASDLIERQAAQISHLQMALADTEALEAETSDRCLKQAAQIEMLKEAVREAREWNWLDDDAGSIPTTESIQSALISSPDQALEQFAAKVREQCAQVCEADMKLRLASEIRSLKELP